MLISFLRRLWARVFPQECTDIAPLQDAAEAVLRSAEAKVRRDINP